MGLIKAFRNLFKGLDMDTNFKMVKQENYLDALDITDVDRNNLNVDLAIQPNPSTNHAFTVGTAALTMKKYRVVFDTDPGGNDTRLIFTLTHRKNTFSVTITVNILSGSDGSTILTEIENVFSSSFDQTPPTSYLRNHQIQSLGTTNTHIEFDMWFPYLNYDDYTLDISYNILGLPPSYPIIGTLPIECQPIQDAVSIEKQGNLKPIAFAQCDNKLFVFSTTGVNEPQNVLVSGMARFDPDDEPPTSGQLVYELLGAGVSDLATSEEIRLVFENVANQVLYGSFQVQEYGNNMCLQNLGVKFVTPNYIAFPGPVINTSSSVTYFKVTRNYRSLSTIGVAEKNPVTGIWQYTELLRTTNLNFRSYKQIEASVIKANDGYILRWTDDLNPMRCLYYRGAFVNQGFLNIFNSENNYNLDTIDDASRLILSSNVAKVDVGTSIDNTNISRKIKGVKPEGNYQAFVRFLTYDDQYTVFSPASNITTIYKDALGLVDPRTIGRLGANAIGGTQVHNSTVASNSALIINVTGINPSLYKQMQVGIVQTVEDSWLFYALPNEEINGKDSIEIIDTGYNPRSYIQLDSTLLNELNFNIKAAQNMTMFDGYTIASNVELAPRYDLTEWAQSIRVTATRRFINYGVSSAADAIYRQYTDFGSYGWLRYASDEYMSYCPFETVRIGVKVWFKGVGAPSVYWIEDKKFDNVAGSGLSGLTDYRIGLGSANNFNMFQYYLGLTNIDLDYILPDGSVLREIVEHIKIVRAEIPKEVLFVGLAINCVFDSGVGFNTPSGDVYRTNVAPPTPPAATRNIYVISPDLEVNKEQIPSGDDTDIYFYSCGVKDATLSAAGDTYRIIEFSGDTDNNTDDDWGTTYNAEKSDYVSFYSASSFTGISTTAPNVSSLPVSWRPGLSIYLSGAPGYSSYKRGYIYFTKPITGSKFPSIYSTNFFDVSHASINVNVIDSDYQIGVYSGDFFPQVQYYLSTIYSSNPNTENRVIGFPCLNRYNQQARSGYFPAINVPAYRGITFDEMNTRNGDPYSVSSCFLPSRVFQNQFADNFETPYYPNQDTGIYWSLKSLQTALFGSNRIFKFANNKVLEQTYGSINGLIPLLGITSQGILLCLQDKRVSIQYFDNTANLVSDAGSLLIGNGRVMERRGTDLTSYGCADKWSIIKGITKSGKETAYWFCSWANAFMRFGDDGTSNISESGFVDAFLNINTKYTMLDNNKMPAHKYGVHGVWDSLNNRAIWTFRLAVKHIAYSGNEVSYQPGLFVDNNETWGFEEFPVLYRSKQFVPAGISLTNAAYWEKIDSYDEEYFKFFTIVYSEDSNTFKTFLTHLPMIYGALNNTIVSSSPRNVNEVYEHNVGKNEAVYYPLQSSSGVNWTSSPPNMITGTNIGTIFPFTHSGGLFNIPEHTKIMVTIAGRNYSIVGRVSANAILTEYVDSDDILPASSGTIFTYSVVNCQDPYIQPIINEYIPRYFSFAGVEVQSDDTLKRIDYEAFTDSLSETYTESYTNKDEFEYFQGRGLAQIKQDTKYSPNDNTASDQFVEGQVMKTRLKFRWGKKNKINNFVVNMVEQNKRFK